MITDTVKHIEQANPSTWADTKGNTYNRWYVQMNTGKEFVFLATIDAQKNPSGRFKKAVGDSITYSLKGTKSPHSGRQIENAKLIAEPKPYAPTVFKGGNGGNTQNEIRSSVAVNNAILLEVARIKTGQVFDPTNFEENSRFIYNLLENLANGR